MKNSKLISLLSTFAAQDWHQFGHYVRSPFFNQTTSLIHLTDALEESLIKKKQADLEIKKEDIFQRVFPNRPFSEKTFNRLCSRLLSLASSYLAYRNWQDDGIASNYYGLQAYLDRKLNKHFQFAYRKAEKKLDQMDARSIHFHQQTYLLSDLAERQLSTDKTQLFGPQLQVAADSFDCYFITQKLQHLCNMVSLNKIQPGTYQIHFAPQIVRMSEQLLHIPVIAIYRSLYLLLTDQYPASHFAQLKSFAVTYEHILPQRELNFIYLILTNHCIRQIRSGKKDYAPTLLELYESALAKGFLMDQDTITPRTFKNIVKIGLGLRRFDWVESFIHQYAPKLNEEERAEARHFNLADLYYHQQDYEKAQLQLREVDYSDVRYYLHGRILLAKIYYITNAWEALDSLLSSFRIYLLRSKKLNRDEKRPYLNFIRILNKVLGRQSVDKVKIKETIEKTPMLTDRTWLLEICSDELMV